MGGRLAALQHLVGNLPLIEGHGKGPPHPHVVERRDRHIEPVVVCAEVRVQHDLIRPFLPVDAYLVQRHIARDVQFPAAERTLLRPQVIDRIKPDAVQPDAVRVPVVLVFLDPDDCVGRPLGEPEGAIAHEIARARPLGAPFIHGTEPLDGRPVYGEVGLVNLHAQEVRRRVFESDL